MSENNYFVEGKTGLWEVVIGLEVHAQITSHAKLFSGASAEFGADPNTHVDYLDAGLPGILPVINQRCVDQAIKTGLGIHGQVQPISVFDRKNYFYADLPLGYQISQFERPIILGGYIDINLEDGTPKRINVTRLHMEQDAGKSTHDLHPSLSYIDLNRAGVALMEIVSEPEMRSPHEAQAYVKKLRTIVRYLGTCDGNMEQGSLRVDANISLHKPGTPFGTRAEIKNVNSVRFLGQAIEYEIQRQLEILESGGEVAQETRLFDPSKGETRSMRSKEDAHDYRYFPDPDLKPLVLTADRIAAVKATMPELPDAKKERFMADYALSAYDADILVAEIETAAYYESVVKASTAADTKAAAKTMANWLIVEVFGAMNREGVALDALPFKPEHLAKLVDLIMDGTISGKIAKDIFAKMWESGKAPDALVDELGLKQISDTSVIEKVVDDIIAANMDKVEAYKGGKVQLFGFFVGSVMKALEGKANPGMVNEFLKKKLG
jgi:aspartyl-tRNA(Asn)/glutamyl-tRNA(Gln) amidotransferase subunit B